jgi:hypothetical protein
MGQGTGEGYWRRNWTIEAAGGQQVTQLLTDCSVMMMTTHHETQYSCKEFRKEHN